MFNVNILAVYAKFIYTEKIKHTSELEVQRKIETNFYSQLSISRTLP